MTTENVPPLLTPDKMTDRERVLVNATSTAINLVLHKALGEGVIADHAKVHQLMQEIGQTVVALATGTLVEAFPGSGIYVENSAPAEGSDEDDTLTL